MPVMSATMAELEARVAALEAKQADYQAVLAAVNASTSNGSDRWRTASAALKVGWAGWTRS